MAFPDYKHAEEMYGGGSSGILKFKEGENRIRILAVSEEPVATHFLKNKPVRCIGIQTCPLHGKNAPIDEKSGKAKSPSVKYPAYVITKEDPREIRLVDLPKIVVKQLTDLKADPEWEFDLPMPYDVNVKYQKDSPAVADMYKVIPSPTRQPLAHQVLEQLASMKSIDDVAEGMRDAGKVEPLLQPGFQNEMGAVMDSDLQELPVIDLDDKEIKAGDIPF